MVEREGRTRRVNGGTISPGAPPIVCPYPFTNPFLSRGIPLHTVIVLLPIPRAGPDRAASPTGARPFPAGPMSRPLAEEPPARPKRPKSDVLADVAAGACSYVSDGEVCGEPVFKKYYNFKRHNESVHGLEIVESVGTLAHLS